MKFYLSMTAGQPVAGIDFIKYAIHGSCVFGVYATDDTKKIEALDALVATKKITAIDQAEYDLCLKKKPADPENLTISNQEQVTQALQPPIKGQGAVVVSEVVEQEVQVPIGQVATAEAALVVAPVVAKEATPEVAESTEATSEAPAQGARGRGRNR